MTALLNLAMDNRGVYYTSVRRLATAGRPRFALDFTTHYAQDLAYAGPERTWLGNCWRDEDLLMFRRNQSGGRSGLRRCKNALPPCATRLRLEPLEQRELLSAVTWHIDETQSYTTLAIPNQTVNVPLSGGGTIAVLVSFKNQNTSQNGAWNTGNTAPLSGDIATDYVDGTSIQFDALGSTITNLNSGSYRPNPAVWDETTSTFTDNSAAPAAFGARIRGSYSIFSFDVAYLAIGSVQDTISSGLLSIDPSGQFAANTTNFGMSSGTVSLQGLTVPLLGDVPSSNGSLSGTGFQAANTAPTATITTPDPTGAPLGRRLTMPFTIPISYSAPDLSAAPLTGTISGVLVANSTLAPSSSSVTKTQLFYKNSTKWNVTNGATFSDDNAIAPDKTAYLPGGGTSAFSAVSSYDKGINGIMVDLSSGTHGVITVNDFQFKRGNNNTPSSWVAATAPTTVTTRAGAGVAGSDRIELLWDNNDSVKKQWLEVIVEGNDTLGGFNTNTGFASSYVFYFGSAIGDGGVGNVGAFQVTSSDEVNARNNPKGLGNPATRSDINDFNRNGLVDSADQIIARNNTTNLGNQLKFLVVGAGGPFAPEESKTDGTDAVVSGLAAASNAGLSLSQRTDRAVEFVPSRLNDSLACNIQAPQVPTVPTQLVDEEDSSVIADTDGLLDLLAADTSASRRSSL
jgi:hypothetical protein